MKIIVKIINITLSVFFITSLNGCVSHYRAQKIEDHLLVVDKKITQLREQQQKDQERIEAQLENINREFEAFQKQMRATIDNLRMGSANDGVNIDTLSKTLQELNGQMSELKHKYKLLTKEDLPETTEGLYDFSVEKLTTKNYKEAIRGFSHFADKYPNDMRADDSLYQLAEAYYAQRMYKETIDTLKRIIENYRDLEYADKSLMLLHEVYLKRNQCGLAMKTLKFLKANYPSSNQIRVVKRKLEELKSTCDE